MRTALRLLTVTPYFESHRGGVEIVAGQIARQLRHRGLEVRWLASDESPPPTLEPGGIATTAFEAVNLTERRYGVPFPLPLYRSVRRIFEEVRNCEIVLAHDVLYMTTLASYVAARFWNKKIVVVQHIGHVRYRHWPTRIALAVADRLVARPVLEGVDQVVFISESSQAHFGRARLRRPPLLVRNGVDPQLFHGPRDRGGRAAFHLPQDRPTALFVGRFIEKKGLHFIAQLARGRGDLHFAFAGWGDPAPSAWALPNVSVFADLAGARLADLYRACDLLLLPSHGEGFPLVIQEALACGLPVVCGAETAAGDPAAAPWVRAVDLAGPSQAVAERLGAALDAAIAADDEVIAAARSRFAIERYSWASAGEVYGGLIERLLAPAAAAAAVLPHQSRGRGPHAASDKPRGAWAMVRTPKRAAEARSNTATA
ncbi:MAG TPA: glycosyltransferase family 4 protein [Caulobacteraceae bacterium]|nr:glycosyltransferase family 4 protein [Caulobacteraceae bacterium]